MDKGWKNEGKGKEKRLRGGRVRRGGGVKGVRTKELRGRKRSDGISG